MKIRLAIRLVSAANEIENHSAGPANRAFRERRIRPA
jgi:hypothetical protein